MKKQKLKSLVKNARRAERKNISLKITSELKAITEDLLPNSKKIEKTIKKDAKQLAKIISKRIHIDEKALADANVQKKSIVTHMMNVSDALPDADFTEGKVVKKKNKNT
jgi:hypothetical protein